MSAQTTTTTTPSFLATIGAGQVLEVSDSEFPPTGVTLRQVRYFIDHFVPENERRDLLPSMTTKQVCDKYMVKLTLDSKVSYCVMFGSNGRDAETAQHQPHQQQQQQSCGNGDDAAGGLLSSSSSSPTSSSTPPPPPPTTSTTDPHHHHQFFGTANIFVSHAWAYNFLDVVDALEHFEEQQHQLRTSATATTATTATTTTTSSSSSSTTTSPSSYIYWFDLFTNSQHDTSKKPFHWWTNCFMNNIKRIGHTLLILQWHNPIPLTRAWCVWEMYCAVSTATKLDIIMSRKEDASFHDALVNEMDTVIGKLCKLDVEKAECYSADDKESIFAAIKASSSITEINRIVANGLRQWMITAGKRVLLEEERKFIETGEAETTTIEEEEGQEQGNGNGPSSASSTSSSASAAASPRSRRRVMISNIPENLQALTGAYSQLLFEQGHFQEAFYYITRLAEHRKKTLGEANPLTIASMYSRASVNRSMNKLDDAEQLIKTYLPLSIQVNGKTSSMTFSYMNLSAGIQHARGKYHEAAEKFITILAARRELHGNAHPETVMAISNLAQTYSLLGELEEAEKLGKEGLATSETIQGVAFPKTIMIRNVLGCLYRSMSRQKEAAELFRINLAASRQTHGEKSPHTQEYRSNVASVLCDMGHLKEAEGLYRECLEINLREHGDTPTQDTMVYTGNLAKLLADDGRLEEAEPFYRDLMTTSKQVVGETHPYYYWAKNATGLFLRDLGRIDEAEALVREAYLNMSDTFKPKHFRTLEFEHDIVTVLRYAKKFAEAEELCLRVLKDKRETLGEGHRECLVSIFELGLICGAMVVEAASAEGKEDGKEAKAVAEVKEQQQQQQHPRMKEALEYLNEYRTAKATEFGAENPDVLIADMAIAMVRNDEKSVALLLEKKVKKTVFYYCRPSE